ALNVIAFVGAGLLAIPGIIALNAPPPPPNTIIVNIGVGDINSSMPSNPNSESLGGSAPEVRLFDINGRQIGRVYEKKKVTEGGAIELKITGESGTSASVVPMYIQVLQHNKNSDSDDPICISWITTVSSSSSNGDFRSWNAATARACDIPWYPSVAPMGGVSGGLFQPPCFWLDGNDKYKGRFPKAMSARLFDFYFPGPNEAGAAMAKQWTERPETLCIAPARQNFYSKPGLCIPFYPSGNTDVNRKDPDNGYDYSFRDIMQNYTYNCAPTDHGSRFFAPRFEDPRVIQAKERERLANEALNSELSEYTKTGGKLYSTLNLGPLQGRAAQATGTPTASGRVPLITDAATLPEIEDNSDSILHRRVENRLQEPEKWCQERRLVISEFDFHSAKDVCESSSSWGPDMAVVPEGLFCDMCTRKVYPIC
ncbi:hypothetical protein QBC34DRAFT_278801, partial [Podospora aff. communis PSN243]